MSGVTLPGLVRDILTQFSKVAAVVVAVVVVEEVEIVYFVMYKDMLSPVPVTRSFNIS